MKKLIVLILLVLSGCVTFEAQKELQQIQEMKKKNPVYEVMIKYDSGRFIVRVWWTVDKLRLPTQKEEELIKDIVNEITVLYVDDEEAMIKIAKEIGKLKECAAVEILDFWSKRGIIYYPDWK